LKELIYFTKLLISKYNNSSSQKYEKLYLCFLGGLIGVLFATEIALIYIGIQKNSLIYFLWTLICIPLLIILYIINKKIKSFQIERYLEENWGTKEKAKHNFEDLEHVFLITKEDNSEDFTLDDQTWNDLNMNKIYEEMDRTYTIPGQHMLYKILRTPILEEQKLKDRDKILNYIENNKKLRFNLQKTLFRLGRIGGDGMPFMLWESKLEESKYKMISSIMAVAAVISILSLLVLGLKGILYLIIPVAIINGYIKYKVNKIVSTDLSTLMYLNMLIGTANEISKSKEDALKEYASVLDSCLVNCGKITNDVSTLLIRTDDPLGLSEYIRLFFLIEVRGYYKAINKIRNHKNDLQKLFFAVGEIDALLSIASYKIGLKGCCIPKLISNSKVIEFENMRHPLIESCIPNSIKILETGVIVTGSNMSGKSTFLRALALNAVLAQTIYICHAESYTGSYLKIMTSISRSDDIMSGKSYYLMEAEAILDMIKNIAENIPSLIIIDEIFRGTNTRERIMASSGILNYLIERNVVTLIATHDLELEGLINEKYDKYYFSEKVGSSGLEFDYLLKKGTSKSSNAIKVLAFLGYPEEITKRIIHS
jgi:hypothetical protein